MERRYRCAETRGYGSVTIYWRDGKQPADFVHSHSADVARVVAFTVGGGAVTLEYYGQFTDEGGVERYGLDVMVVPLHKMEYFETCNYFVPVGTVDGVREHKLRTADGLKAFGKTLPEDVDVARGT